MSCLPESILAERTENFIRSCTPPRSLTKRFRSGWVRSSRETALFSLMWFRKGSSWDPKLQVFKRLTTYLLTENPWGKRSRGRLQSWFCRVSSLLKPSKRE